MKTPTIDELRAAMEAKGYPFFEKDDYNVNTVAIRAASHDESGELAGNRFNDLLCVAFKRGGAWEVHAYPCTTVPGDHYMAKPMNAEFGTAIIAPGFYRGSHCVGLHYGHPALVQRGPLGVYRDNDRDLALDLENLQQVSGAGLNIHYGYGTQTVDNGSAGCIEHQCVYYSGIYEGFMHIYEMAAKAFGNKFSLALLVEGDVWPVETAKPAEAGIEAPPEKKGAAKNKGANRQEG